MKQKILYIFVLITALLGGNSEAWAWGENTSYIFEDANERSWTSPNNSGKYDFSGRGPVKTLIFQARRTKISVFGNSKNFYAQYSVDGGKNWENALKLDLDETDKWYDFSCNIPENANCVRMVTEAGATGQKYIRNVKVTRATTLSMSSTNTLPLNMGEIKIGKTVSATVNVDFNNTTYNQELTGTCTNTAFTIESRSMGEYGTNVPVTIKFSPATADTHTGTVTLSMNGKTTSFKVTGTAQDKGRPAFTWTLSNLATGREYTDFFSSTNTDTPVSYVSSDASIANVVEGKLVTSSKEGTATITVTQQGNDDWHEKTQSFTVNVSKPQNHLPLAINESNWSVLARNISGGSFKWDGGIKLGDGGGGFNWEDKIAQIEFLGIPDRISFDYDAGADGASYIEWKVESSSNGNDFEAIWTSSSASGSADIEIKDKSSKYVRLIWSGNFGGFFKNVKISELRYLTSTASSLDFGENVEGDAVSKTFTVKHANAGYGVTLTSSSPDVFEVSPTVLTATGGDKMGEETITVTYKNNTPGSHTGTITIADPNGSNADITINVSGSTLSNTLFLNPTETPNYDVRTYKRIVLQRTLPMGYSTITLPFTYDIDNMEGGAFVAQLELVTHNQQDCYTLYFRKVADGVMQPNQPYVLYMPFEIRNKEWGETAISSPEAQSIVKNGWIMQGNYKPKTPMNGNFGIAKGLLCKGEGENAKINAYTAYFIPPTHSHGTENVRARVAVMDEGGNTTYIGELKDLDGNAAEEVFGIDGMRLPEMRKGINIVRQKDGSVRKIVK